MGTKVLNGVLVLVGVYSVAVLVRLLWMVLTGG